MLTQQERELVSKLFAGGPGVLLDEGMSASDIAAFMARPEVASVYATLRREMDFQQEIEARTRHVSRRQISQLAPGAVAILAKALAGPQYLTYRTPDGGTAIRTDDKGRPILARAEILPSQLRSAEVVLDAIGVLFSPAKNDQANLSTGPMDAMLKQPDTKLAVSLDDPSHSNNAERTLSRERVRTVIECIAGRIPSVRAKLLEGQPATQAEPTKKKAPPRGRKKAPSRQGS